jgi:hypothetical protein
MLAFAAVHWKFDGMTVRAMEGFVAMEKSLDVVVAGRNVFQVADRIAKGVVVRNDDGLSGSEGVDIGAEHNLSFDREADLHAGFFGGVSGEENEYAAVKRLGAAFFGKGDGEFWGSRLRAKWECEGEESEREGKQMKGATRCDRHVEFLFGGEGGRLAR